jgi:hypothetical protein
MALITSPTSVLSLSPEKDEEREPFSGGHLDERLHARGHAAHVGRAAEDDCIGGVQFVQLGGGFFRGVELGGDSGHALGASEHGLSLKFGVPVDRMINDGDLTHGVCLAIWFE